MPDPDIEVIRAQLAAAPRPANLAERRGRLDALGGRYTVPPEATVEPVSANGVDAEWTVTPGADPSRRGC